MGWGSWLKNENSAQTSEESKQTVWGDQLGDAVAEARSRGMGNKKRTKTGSTDGESESRRGSVGEEAKKFFDPSAWEPIVKAPFAIGKVLTGRGCWDLTEKEVGTLSVTTSSTAEYFMQTDPKWVALTLCAFNWSVIFTEKFLANAKERLKEEELQLKDKPKPHIV